MTRSLAPSARAALDALLRDDLVKGGRIAANWMADGRFWFAENAPEDTSINALDPTTGKIEALFDTAKVRAALARVIGREPPYRGLPFPTFAPTPDGGAAFSFEGADYVLNAAQDQVTPQPGPNGMDTMTGMGVKQRTTPGSFVRPSYFTAGAPVPEMMSPDGRWFVGVADNNLYLRSTADGRRIALTTDGEPDCSWDVESTRMRLTPGMGIIFGAVSPWAPDGMKLFATRFDERGGSEVHHLNWLKRHDEVVRSTWILAGEKLPVIEPYVIDIMGRRPLRIQVDTVDKFLLPIGWTPDGGHILIALYARDMSAAEVVLADAATGEARVLMREDSDTFLRLQHDVVMGRSGCTLLPDGSGFLWLSDRDGHSHIFQYDMAGRLLAQLTKGDWVVRDVIGVDQAKGEVWFLAYHDPERPYDAHLCRAPLGGGKVTRLTDGEGVHEIQLAPGFGCFIDTVSRPGAAPQSTVRDASGKALHVFPPADISALEAAGWSAPEQFCVKAADGETDLWGVLYKPPGFDPKKSYPVLEYVYGGPQVSVAPHFFQPPASGMRGLITALPQLGYVTVVLDARGTPERSKAFLDATYRDWRRHLTSDHAAALRNLGKDRPWMDLDRVGIWGFSWGGYTTLACLLDEPEVYKAGVSSSPGYDPYSSFLYEPYLAGVPQAHNKAAYDDASMIGDVGKLEGKLMIVAGTNDVGVWHDVVKMSNALIEARKDHELVMMPGQGHGYGALHEMYYIDKLVGHFERHVKAPGIAS